MSESNQKLPFATERTARFLASDIDDSDRRYVTNIEEFGCSIIHVMEACDSQAFSYTFGVYDTCGQPEIIQIGLVNKTAHYVLNEAVRRLRKGENLAEGRHAGLIGDFDCAFRPLDPKWIGRLMNYARWFNGGGNFPALQAVWPDFQNRLPWDDGFDKKIRARQPLLYVGATQTKVEDDLWAAMDPKSKFPDWKFPEKPHTTTFLSEPVSSGAEAVVYVKHGLEDGIWEFYGDSMSADLPPKISCLHHPIDNDVTLKELFDLPRGWYAERATTNHPWVRGESPPEEEEQSEP